MRTRTGYDAGITGSTGIFMSPRSLSSLFGVLTLSPSASAAFCRRAQGPRLKAQDSRLKAQVTGRATGLQGSSGRDSRGFFSCRVPSPRPKAQFLPSSSQLIQSSSAFCRHRGNFLAECTFPNWSLCSRKLILRLRESNSGRSLSSAPVVVSVVSVHDYLLPSFFCLLLYIIPGSSLFLYTIPRSLFSAAFNSPLSLYHYCISPTNPA